MGGGVEKRKIDVFLFRYISDKVFLPKSFLLYFLGEMYFYKHLTKKEIFFFHISRKSFEKV